MRARRIVEELCMDDACPREDSHWHPFRLESLLSEKDGEYTITVRVRSGQDAQTHRERVLRCLGTAARLSAREIADCEGVPIDAVRTLLSKLTAAGLARRCGRGQYAACAPRQRKESRDGLLPD